MLEQKAEDFCKIWCTASGEIATIEVGDLLYGEDRDVWCLIVRIIGPWRDWSQEGKHIGVKCQVINSEGEILYGSFATEQRSFWQKLVRHPTAS